MQKKYFLQTHLLTYISDQLYELHQEVENMIHFYYWYLAEAKLRYKMAFVLEKRQTIYGNLKIKEKSF